MGYAYFCHFLFLTTNMTTKNAKSTMQKISNPFITFLLCPIEDTSFLFQHQEQDGKPYLGHPGLLDSYSQGKRLFPRISFRIMKKEDGFPSPRNLISLPSAIAAWNSRHRSSLRLYPRISPSTCLLCQRLQGSMSRP